MMGRAITIIRRAVTITPNKEAKPGKAEYIVLGKNGGDSFFLAPKIDLTHEASISYVA